MIHRPAVETAYYGLGALIPVIVLAPAGWWQRAVTAVPEPHPAGGGHALVLRWCGPAREEDTAGPLLVRAACAAPGTPVSAGDAVAYQAALPAHLRLVALPLSCVISRRPVEPTPPESPPCHPASPSP